MCIYKWWYCTYELGISIFSFNFQFFQDLTGEEIEKIESRQSVFRDDCQPKERKQDGGIRYCKKCRHLKPDRTHHCSACDQ